MNGNGARHELEQRADAARARLLGTLAELDRRGHEILDWKLQLRRHSREVSGAFGGLAAGVVLTAGIVAYRVSRRERRRRQERWHAIDRLWHHPERVAARKSALGTAARMLLVAFATMATTTLALNQLDRFRSRPRLPRPPTEPIGV
jgi:hypothetical protein